MSSTRRERFHIDEALATSSDRRLRRLPGLLTKAVELVWAAGRRELLASAAFHMASGVGVVVQLLLTRELLAELLSGDAEPGLGDMAPELVGVGLVTAALSVASTARIERTRVLAELVSRHTSKSIIATATRAPLVAFEDPDFHDRLQRASVNASARPLQMTTGVMGLVAALPAVAGVAAALLLIEPLICVLAFGAYVPVWVATNRAGHHQHRYSLEQTERDRRRNYLYLVLTRKAEAPEVRAFGFGSWMLRRYDELWDRRIADLREVARRRLRLSATAGVGSSVLAAGTFAVLLWLVTSDRTDLAAAATAAAALVLVGQRLQVLASSLGGIYESSLFLEDFTSFTEGGVAAKDEPPAPPLDFSVLKAEGVTFTYPSSESPAVDGINLEIRRGEVVALVGENGSGKTTLAKILAGLYEPGTGTVSWDGVPHDELDPATIRATVTVAFQDYARFHLTASQNIGIADAERIEDTDAVMDAARSAGALDDLRALPFGLQTQLGPEYYGGTDLSSGQWQRLALARAFFRVAPLLVLDEPTAALDPRAEAELFSRIRDLLQGRSVLLISHRFSSVHNADRIFVLHQGKLVEKGTHEELMTAGGRYRDLYRLQAAAYLKAGARDE